MPDVTIKKHFKIVGQPGTVLHFNSSLLVIDLLPHDAKSMILGDERDYFRHQEPIVFSEIQLVFSIDLRAVAYKQYKNSRGFGGHSQFDKSMSSKQPPATHVQHEHEPTRTLVQLISLKAGTKAEFRDCSFKCTKVYQKKNPKSSRSIG